MYPDPLSSNDEVMKSRLLRSQCKKTRNGSYMRVSYVEKLMFHMLAAQ